MTQFQSTKTFHNYPCAHRQWRHEGHCSLVHGYSRSFHFVFGAQELDKCGFVVDYSSLKSLKAHLDYMYDHTLLLNHDDPLLDDFKKLEAAGACQIRIHRSILEPSIPLGVGMEGTAQYLCEYADQLVKTQTKGRAWVHSVEARENDKNSSIYYNPFGFFEGWK